MSQNKKVSAVIPNYNGRELMAKHLPAVIDCLRSGDELVIVDDASTDDSIDWLRKAFHLSISQKLADYQVHAGELNKNIVAKVIANKTNVRFGESVNRGVVIAEGDFILLLNSDVKPKPKLLESLMPHFDSPKVFAVGCLEEEQGQSKERIWGGKNKLWFERGMFIHSRADDYSSGSTAWVSGGSGLFDRKKWLELGGFDPDYYPAYWEDIDLSYRAQLRGWQTLFEEKAIVEHHHETTNTTVFGQHKINQISWKNAGTFAWKNGTIDQIIQHLLWQPYWWWKRKQSLRIT